ncbi:MAG: HD domain-containing protein [Proteobacteria bacterium]|nr:MAG: HD domain-containing protein [Pseudomonadota bacterium]
MKHADKNFKALRVCELPNAATDFPLFIEKDGVFVPYTKGRHVWSIEEKVELLQHSQFVLFFETSAEAHVKGQIQETRPESLDTDDFSLTIADGISEFIKSGYALAMTPKQSVVFKALATALSRYLYQQPRIRELLEKLAHHDSYSFYHGFRTAAFSVALNSKEKYWDIALGAILHDIGNIYISPMILNRRGPLREDEWKVVKKHPEEGHDLLEQLHLSDTILDMVIHHHERADGHGYPHRLRKKDLSREVRLLAFCEVFAALTKPRSYQISHSSEEAYQLMQTGLSAYLDESLLEPMATLLNLPQSMQATA